MNQLYDFFSLFHFFKETLLGLSDSKLFPMNPKLKYCFFLIPYSLHFSIYNLELLGHVVDMV